MKTLYVALILAVIVALIGIVTGGQIAVICVAATGEPCWIASGIFYLVGGYAFTK